MDFQYQDGLDFATLLDNYDPLAHFRKTFHKKIGSIYMCGNSLGLASDEALDSLMTTLHEWKQEGVGIWGIHQSKYYLLPSHLAKKMAPLVGADPDEVAIAESTTVNIHQTISTFYKPTDERYKILVDDLNFATDRYAIDSQVRFKGYEPTDAVKVVPSRDGRFIDEDDIIAGMSDDVALVFFPTVYYRSAQVLDMVKVTKAAKERGITIGWDLCHAAGAIDVNLKDLDADFAVWCTYKYLNGGPGSPAALYINRKHFQKLPGLCGWFGNKKSTQFLLRQEFDHQEDATGWQIGTPALLSMSTLEGSLKIFEKAGIANIRKKSLHITGYMIYLVDNKLTSHGFSIGNLREDNKRGGHVCIEHEEAYRISVALKNRNIVQDFREPNIIRLTPVALYTTYVEVYKMVENLLDIVKTESYKEVSKAKTLVV